MAKRIAIATLLLIFCIVLTIYAADFDKQLSALFGAICGIVSGVLYRDTHYIKWATHDAVHASM